MIFGTEIGSPKSRKANIIVNTVLDLSIGATLLTIAQLQGAEIAQPGGAGG